MDLEQLGIKLGIEERFLHYFFGGTVSKPIFNKNDKTLKLEVKVTKVLPYTLYANLIDKLENTFKYKTSLMVICEDHNVSVKDVQAYFDDFIMSTHNLRSKNYLININDKQEIMILYTQEEHRAELQKIYVNLQLFFIQVGIKNIIKLQESKPKIKVATVENFTQTSNKTQENKVFDYGAQNHYDKVKIIELKDGLE